MFPEPGHWSYYGAAHRYDVHGDADAERRCEVTLTALRTQRREDELRARAATGDRCAFVALVGILVDEDRTDELRSMAEDGDGRARTTLMEVLAHQGREDELRAEVASGLGTVEELLGYLCGRGRVGDALDALARWSAEHPQEAWSARHHRLQVLLTYGHLDPVGRLDETLDELTRWALDHPRHAAWVDEQRVETLRRYGRGDDVERSR